MVCSMGKTHLHSKLNLGSLALILYQSLSTDKKSSVVAVTVFTHSKITTVTWLVSLQSSMLNSLLSNLHFRINQNKQLVTLVSGCYQTLLLLLSYPANLLDKTALMHSTSTCPNRILTTKILSLITCGFLQTSKK
jgi:hypothetical protein